MMVARPTAQPPGETAERFIRARGYRLRVLIRPASVEPARPLLILNGIGSRADVLDPLMATLDASMEVIRIDPPGVGKSPPWGLPYSIPWMASVMVRALDLLGYDVVDLAGYSWGGLLAQQIALQYARRVRRLVLLATNTGVWSVPGSTLSMAMMYNPFVAQLAHADNRSIGQIYGGLARTRPAEVREILGPDLDTHGIGLMMQVMAAMTWTTLPFTWCIRQPTLVFTGDDDPMVPQVNAQILTETIPDSRLRVFTGGHLDPLLDPARFGPEISRFLRGD